jgi:hypothetical protein
MTRVQVSARLNPAQLKQAQKALAAKTASEAIQRALDLVTEKTIHDKVVRKYSGVGAADAFEKE